MIRQDSFRPVRQWATVARGPASPLLSCGPCREVAHPDDVVTQKRRFANIGTRAPACATLLSMRRADRADKNRIFLGGRRQGACRSSLGLHRFNQHPAQAIAKDVRTSASHLSPVVCLHFGQ